MLEVHWRLGAGIKKRDVSSDFWGRTQAREIEENRLNILSTEDALIVLAEHLRHHNGSFSLKGVLDAARLIDSDPGIDWGYIIRQGKQYRMRASLYYLFREISLFTNASIPPGVPEDLGVPSWKTAHIEKLLRRGFFSSGYSQKEIFPESRILLYDNLKESIWYSIYMPRPYEGFCKYCRLNPNSLAANYMYIIYWSARFVYIPVMTLLYLTRI